MHLRERTQVSFWFDEFRRGRWSLDDEQSCGTTATVVTVIIIEAAEKCIRAEPRVTTREIQESLSIGTAATMSISVSYTHLRAHET